MRWIKMNDIMQQKMLGEKTGIRRISFGRNTGLPPVSCFRMKRDFFLILSELLRTMRTGRLQCVELGLEQTCRHFKISSIFVELKKRVKKPCIIFISPQINFLIVSTLKLCLFPCLSNQCKEYFNGYY